MAQRTGIPTMIGVAKRLCYLINAFTPVIQKKYPTNAALLAALAAANAACAVLQSELVTVREFGD